MTHKTIGFEKFLTQHYEEYKKYFEKTFGMEYSPTCWDWFKSLGETETFLIVNMYGKHLTRNHKDKTSNSD